MISEGAWTAPSDASPQDRIAPAKPALEQREARCYTALPWPARAVRSAIIAFATTL